MTRDVDLELVDGYLHTFAVGNDSQLAALCDLAEHYRLPVSTFDKWSDHDLAKAMAWRLHKRRYQAETCRNCGTHPSEWEGGRNAEPLIEPVIMSCRGCKEAAIVAQDIEDHERGWLRIEFHPIEDDDEDQDDELELDDVEHQDAATPR